MGNKKPPDNNNHIEAAIKLLREAGYAPRRVVHAKYKKQSFEVEENLLLKFYATQEALGWKVKEAINDAIEEWTRAHKDSLKDK